ncbi:MAG TPA: hypothetical protein VHD91_00010 [Gaiellaceae bacterium]|nr:hypothetical protein [Gaiellaceae bacterium]
MSTYDDDDLEFDFFEEPEPEEPRRRRVPRRGGGPRRPAPPPTGAVALARLVGLVAIGIAVVVAFVFWVGACQGKSKQDEYSSYMSSVGSIASSSARVGQEFAAKLGEPGLKLADLETSLEQWSQQEQQAYDQAELIRPPGPLRALHVQVLDALQLRALGLAGIASTLAQTNVKDSTTEANALANQAQLLTASDIVWVNLYKAPATQTLKALGITGVVVPASQFVTNPDIVSSRSFSIVYQRLRPASTGGTASGVHGSSLVGTKAVGGGKTVQLTTGSPSTIYVAANLKVEATVSDSGGFQEVNIPVVLTVSLGGKTLLTQKKTINGLQPGEQTTVAFSNLPLTPNAFGHAASITIVVKPVPGEQKLDNNTATYPVLFQLSQP